MALQNTFYLNLSTANNLGIGLFKYTLKPRQRFLITNSTLAKILEYPSKNELNNVRLKDLFFEKEDASKFFKILEKEGKVKFFETKFKTTRGWNRWVAITASRVTTEDKKVYIEGIIEDITNHKDMEKDLELERDFLQGLLDNIPDAIYFKDGANRIIKVNKFYEQGVGLKPEEIVGKTDFDFFPYEQAKRMTEDDQYVLSGKPIIGKVEKNLLPNGTWNKAITTKIPMHDRAGKIIGTMGITRDITEYSNLEQSRVDMMVNAMAVLGKAVEMRDPYTFGHARRVAIIAEKIAQELGWDENRTLSMRLAAELHDLGKIGIPLDILNKPGKLSDLEYKLVQEHVVKCYDLIKTIEFPFPIADIVYQHHERIDGNGYPNRLKGKEIKLEAKILAVSDVLEAMTHYRPYREALGLERAVAELKDGSGTRYDSNVVDIVIKLINSNGKTPFWLHT